MRCGLLVTCLANLNQIAAAGDVIRSTNLRGTAGDVFGATEGMALVAVNVTGCDCSWLWRDNCTQNDSCTSRCREANPDGPCHYKGGDEPAHCPLIGNYIFSYKDGHSAVWLFEEAGSHVFVARHGTQVVNGSISFMGKTARLAWSWKDQQLWCSGVCPDGPFVCNEGSSFKRSLLSETSSPATSAPVETMNSTADPREASSNPFRVADVPKNAGGCDCSWIWRDNCVDSSRCSLTCREANPDGPCHYLGGDAPAHCPLAGKFMFNHTDGYKTNWEFEESGPHVFRAHSGNDKVNGTISFMGSTARLSWRWRAKLLWCSGSCPDGPYLCNDGSSLQRSLEP